MKVLGGIVFGLRVDTKRITGVREVTRALRNVEPESLKDLKKEIQSEIQPSLKGVRSFIQGAEDRLKQVRNVGVFHNGRTGWSGATVRLSFTPSKHKGSILSIVATGKNKQAGYDIAEIAGRYTEGSTPQGKAYVGMLRKTFPPGKAGRFAYRAVVSRLPEIRKNVQKILDKYGRKVSIRIESK